MSSNDILLSYIVPVYNTPKAFLISCLDNLKKIGLSNVEFLIVNDGSTVDLVEVFSRFKDDSRFKIMNKENSGVSDTRNYGINHSLGQYIVFVDSDDIEKEFIPSVIEELESYEYDLFLFNASSINSKGKIMKNIIFNTFDDKLGCGVVWAKIFKREMLVSNNIIFNSNIKYAEDSLFMAELFKHKPNVKRHADISVYEYRVSNDHTTTRYNPNIFYDFNNTYVESNKYYPIEDFFATTFHDFYHYMLGMSFYNKKCNLDSKAKIKEINKLLTNDSLMYKEIFKYVDLSKLSKYGKIQYRLFKKEKYYLMYKLDKIICKIFKKI